MIHCKSKSAVLRLWWGLSLCTPTFLCSSRYRFLRCVYDLRVLVWNGAEMESLRRERRDEENIKTFFPLKKYNTMHKHDGQQRNSAWSMVHGLSYRDNWLRYWLLLLTCSSKIVICSRKKSSMCKKIPHFMHFCTSNLFLRYKDNLRAFLQGSNKIIRSYNRWHYGVITIISSVIIIL